MEGISGDRVFLKTVIFRYSWLSKAIVAGANAFLLPVILDKTAGSWYSLLPLSLNLCILNPIYTGDKMVQILNPHFSNVGDRGFFAFSFACPVAPADGTGEPWAFSFSWSCDYHLGTSAISMDRYTLSIWIRAILRTTLSKIQPFSKS